MSAAGTPTSLPIFPHLLSRVILQSRNEIASLPHQTWVPKPRPGSTPLRGPPESPAPPLPSLCSALALPRKDAASRECKPHVYPSFSSSLMTEETTGDMNFNVLVNPFCQKDYFNEESIHKKLMRSFTCFSFYAGCLECGGYVTLGACLSLGQPRYGGSVAARGHPLAQGSPALLPAGLRNLASAVPFAQKSSPRSSRPASL